MSKRKADPPSATAAKRAREPSRQPKESASLLPPLTLSLSQEAAPAAVGTQRAPRDALLLQRPSLAATAASAAPAGGSACAAAEGSGLWCDMHAPATEADLAVANKKVDVLRAWLQDWKQQHRQGQVQQQDGSAGARGTVGGSVPNCMILTGPSGCGKSCLARVLGSSLGFALSSWSPPVPTSWEEHRYQRDASAGYTSKVADFEEYAGRAKLGYLDLVPSRGGTGNQQGQGASEEEEHGGAGQDGQHGEEAPPKLLVVDDLPYAASAEQRARITSALTHLVASSGSPVVVMFTDGGKEEQGGGGRSQAAALRGLHKDVVDSLEGLGAGRLALNPLTTAACCKALAAVAKAHGLALAKDDATALAQAADGDLRSAISSLQFLATGVKPVVAPAAAGGRVARSRSRGGAAAGAKKKAAAGAQVPVAAAAKKLICKDSTLGMFHGLGKILYNKRMPQQQAAAARSEGGAAGSGEGSAGSGSGAGPRAGGAAGTAGGAQQPQLLGRRPAPEADAEAVLEHSGLDPGSVASFLHEHYPSFVDEGAVEDAAMALEYLCASDVLCNYWGSLDSTADAGSYRTTSLTAAIAGSVAARGWMWANRTPAPRRWLPLDGPALPTVLRAAADNREAVHSVIRGPGAAAGLMCDASTFATTYIPPLRTMNSVWGGYQNASRLLPRKWLKVWTKQIHVAHENRDGWLPMAGNSVQITAADWADDPAESIEDSE